MEFSQQFPEAPNFFLFGDSFVVKNELDQAFPNEVVARVCFDNQPFAEAGQATCRVMQAINVGAYRLKTRMNDKHTRSLANSLEHFKL